MLLQRIWLVAACVVFFASAPAVHACGFIETGGKAITLRDDAETSQIILFGRLENARGTPDKGTTDLVILKTLKTDPAIAGKKVVTLPRFLPINDPKNPLTFLVFAEVKDGTPEFFRGIEGKSVLADYVEGLLKIDMKDRVKLMRYAFDYLEHETSEVASDALSVFMKSTDPDISKAAKTLSAEKLRRFLQDERTNPSRLRLYGFMLACAGNRDDAKLLRTLLDRLVKEDFTPQFDGILTGYTLLAPKEGWAFACELVKSDKQFLIQY